jgi:tRNA pseudouridine55 synthase
MGKTLSCGAVMSGLVRTKACGFSLSDCVTLEDLQELANKNISAEKYLYPIEKVFGYLREIKLNEHQEKLYRSGVRLDLNRMPYEFSDGEKFRIYAADGSFIGTAKANSETGELMVDKNF